MFETRYTDLLMKTLIFPTRQLLVLLAVTLLSMDIAAAGIKKWVDADGITHYGTSIPPEYVNQGHTELNSRGIAVKQIGRARTPEEIAREKELERLRKLQDQAVAEQRAKDRILLNMYRNEDDLEMVRNGKVAQIDSQIKLKQLHIERLKARLAKWQGAAAARERQGKKPTPKQLENLDSLQKLLEVAYSDIVEKEASKRRIIAHYDRELRRFQQLKSGFRANTTQGIEEPRTEPRVVQVAGAFACRDQAECDRLWPRAKRWTKSHSGTPVEVIGDRILVTRIPKQADEVSLTLSRLKRGNVERLFLDVNCQKTVAGRDLCASKPVQALRDQFVDAMRLAAENRGTALSGK